jgi:Xaa-Pro aminopeptidase
MNNLKKLRKFLKIYKLHGYLIPRNDEYFNEYVNPAKNRLKFISNFSGSVGLGITTLKKNYLFVDGRYTLQANKESGKNFQIENIQNLFKINLGGKKILGFDPALFNLFTISKLKKNKNLILKSIPENLIDKINKKKKKNNFRRAFFVERKWLSSDDAHLKRLKILKILKLRKNQIFLITSSENINWLLNIRGGDSNFTPILNCFAILNKKKEHIDVFCDLKKISKKLKKESIYARFHEEKNIYYFLKKNKEQILFDKNFTSVKLFEYIKKYSKKFKMIKDPIYFEKSKKTVHEIESAKMAHQKDGVAVTKFIIWIKNQKVKHLDEIKAQKKLENFRKKSNLGGEYNFYQGPSFATISAFEKNGAIIHYNALNHKKTRFKNNSSYLVDSGGQYKFGTTDITRTICFGNVNKKRKEIYTRILKGHIAVNNFDLKKNTMGSHVDKVARKYLKEIGLDYEHGTGHGVGHFLNVHENPPNISKYSKYKFYEGQIVSNEPGFYLKNNFGIRLENLMYVEKNNKKMQFKPLTLVPFDKDMIEKKYLTKHEINWINNYHNEVWTRLWYSMNEKEKKILSEKYCSPV